MLRSYKAFWQKALILEVGHEEKIFGGRFYLT